jgi:YtkA-like
MKKSVLAIGFVSVIALVTTAACGSKTASNGGGLAVGRTIKAVTVGNLTATLSNSTGQLKPGNQEVMLAFADSSGKLVDVGAMSLNFHMDQMGTMSAMNDSVTFTTTSTPGVCRGKVHIEVAGEWQGQLAYEGPAGSGKTTFTVTAQ